jgi:hypothetical protein
MLFWISGELRIENYEYFHISPEILMQIFAGLSPQMNWFDLRSVMWNLWWKKWHWGKMQEFNYLSVLLKDKDPIWAKLVTTVQGIFCSTPCRFGFENFLRLVWMVQHWRLLGQHSWANVCRGGFLCFVNFGFSVGVWLWHYYKKSNNIFGNLMFGWQCVVI